MNQAYIAAPIFSDQHLQVVNQITAVLKMHEYEYFSPYEASRPVWQGRAPKDCTPEERATVVRGNIDGMRWADVLVAWVGGQRNPMASTDTGVVWEMGYFNALTNGPSTDEEVIGVYTRRKRFTLGYIHPNDIKRDMNLMLAGTVDAIAYGQAELSQALSFLGVDELDACRTLFAPSKRVLHERDPIT